MSHTFKKILVACILFLSVFSGGFLVQPAQAEETINIGILQFIEHEALDDAREGFMEELEASEYGDRIKFDVQNASGDNASLQSLSEKLARDNDILYAIATPAAIGLAAVESEKPIFFAAVTDPVDVELVESLEKPGKNLTGTSDMAPIKKQVDLLIKNFPEAKKIGVIYDSGEMNSIVAVKEAKTHIEKAGLELVEGTVTSTNDIQQTMAALVADVDAFFMVTDNTIDSSIALVGDMAIDAGKPMVGSSAPVVEKNGLMTLSNSYVEYGKQTAQMVIRMLDQDLEVSEMPVELGENFELVINEKNAKKLNLDIKAIQQ